MAAVPNSVRISGPIAPFDAGDNYATHISKYGVGGYYAVPTFEDLALIPASRLGDGEPLVYVKALAKFYMYLDAAWVEVAFGGGDCCTVFGTELDGDQLIRIHCEAPVNGNNWFFDNFNVLNNTRLTGAGDLA